MRRLIAELVEWWDERSYAPFRELRLARELRRRPRVHRSAHDVSAHPRWRR